MECCGDCPAPDDRSVTPEQLRDHPHAVIMDLTHALPLLASPDSGKSLRLLPDESGLADGEHLYPVVRGAPVLYPGYVGEAFLRGGLKLDYYADCREQYFLLSQIKQRGEINAPFASVHYQRHLFRMRDFVRDCCGTVLDVGCDDASISASLFPQGCSYIGLDPFSASASSFRVIGVGECLPFADQSLDNVVFNTSLDHILDHHTAIEEACRVLKPGGFIFLATLIWSRQATLLTDAVHFHHFREYEILGLIGHLAITATKKYSYKSDTHRCAYFVAAKKPG